MRASLPVISVYLILVAALGRFGAAIADTPNARSSGSTAPTASPTATPPPATNPTATNSATTNPAATAPAGHSPSASAAGAHADGTSADEAAAKHAKRTACLKSAREKKLVGAQKTGFVKDCVGAP